MSHSKLLDILWLTLMAMTLGSAYIAESADACLFVTLIMASVIGFKGIMIVDHFMEQRHANRHFRFLKVAYFFVIPSMIVLVYLFPETIARLTTL